MLKDIPITHIKSNRRSIRLSVDPDGKVILRTPHYISHQEVNNFIQKQAHWISTKVTEAKAYSEEFSFTHNSQIPFKGETIILSHSKDIMKASYNDDGLQLPKTKDIKPQLEQWYREQARVEITRLVKYYTEILGVKYNRIFIKNQKTRWGSCSGKKNLNFNWKIILTEPALIKYLVIHETCHLREMNHSTRFWQLVEALDPNYRRHRNELQKLGHYLRSFLNY